MSTPASSASRPGTARIRSKRSASVDRLPNGAARVREYAAYERDVTNCLVLVSCHLRNVFDIFPRLNEQYAVPMFYAEFFTRVAAKAGGESLLALGDRNERLRAGTT